MALIPVYMHGATIKVLLDKLVAFGYYIIVIDDGNPKDLSTLIQEAVKAYEGVVPIVLVRHEKNMGKGMAMTSGILKAKELGLTHVLQIDADLQHDPSYCKSFFELSIKYPEAIICGYPEYDDTVPISRKNGRKIANFWIHLNSLDWSAKDSMCGFRVYLVDKYLAVNAKHKLPNRMCIDAQVLIYSSWEGVPIVSAPVKVTYPKDGVSNYNVLWDNVKMALMFVRTFLGMIVRLPMLLGRKFR